MQCRRSFVCAILVLLIFAIDGWAEISVPETQTVTAWGEALLTSDPVVDKERAVAQARRTALEKVVGVFVTSTTEVRNFQVIEDRIYAKSSGFINHYEILEENRAEIHRVRIRAEVSLTPVTEILRESGMLRKWRVGVIMVPDHRRLDAMRAYYSPARLVDVSRNIESVIGRQLVNAGFKLVDPRYLEKLREQLGDSQQVSGTVGHGLDLLVTGSVSLAARHTGGSLHQSTCQIHGKILRVDTGEIVYQGNVGNTFDGVSLLVDRSLAEKYAENWGNGQLADGTPDLRTYGSGVSAALEKAINLAAAMAADEILSQITRVPASVSSTIVLEIRGVDFDQLMMLEDYLNQLQGVANLNIEEFSGQSKTMEVEYDADAMTLARALAKSKTIDGLGLIVESVSKSKIVLKKQ